MSFEQYREERNSNLKEPKVTKKTRIISAPKLYEARLSEETVAALRSVLGETIFRIYAPTLELSGKYALSPSMSLHREGIGYVVIENAWMETPIEYIDYWQISARLSRTPKVIKTRIGRDGAGDTLYYPSQINLAFSSAAINRIVIHEETWSNAENQESIAYDHALVFYREDGSKFCISAYPTNQDSLEYTEDESEINSTVEAHKLRLELV